MVLPLMERDLAVLRRAAELSREQSAGAGQEQRRRYLQDRKGEIEKALGELTGEEDGIGKLAARVAEADMSGDARAEAERQLRRVEDLRAQSQIGRLYGAPDIRGHNIVLTLLQQPPAPRHIALKPRKLNLVLDMRLGLPPEFRDGTVEHRGGRLVSLSIDL